MELLRSFAIRGLLVFGALLLSGCALLRSAPEASPSAPAAADAVYRLGPEDVLDVSVWKEEGLKQQVLVRPDGFISFPLVGDVQAAGRTTVELRAVIEEGLKRYIADPLVSVTVLKVAANKIYVIGKVARPGEYAAGRYVDVLQALSMAGGLTPFAAENEIKVVRKEGGRDVALPVRFSDLRKGVALEQNLTLRDGDVVVVP
jgi:polysaccharide export outer membrane protein